MSKVSYVKQKINNSRNGVSRYENSEINSKWVDYIFALVFTDFQRKINGNKDFKKQKLLASNSVYVDLQKQKVTINRKFRFKKLMEYFLYLLELFAAMIKIKRKSGFKNLCFFYGVNWNQIKNNDSSLENLHRFIKTFFFDKKIINESRVILVTGREFPKLKPHKNLIPSNYISTALVRYLSLSGKIQIFILCLRTITSQFIKMFRDKNSLMNLPILDQIILDKSCKELNIKITIICTQSVLLSPPLTFYYNRDYVNLKIGFWYSDNNLAIPHESQSAQDFSYDFFRIDLLDRIFVWSESYASVLRKHTVAKIEVTEPILMNSQSRNPSELMDENRDKVVSFFGISPLVDLADLHFNQLQNSIDDLTAISALVQNDTFSEINFILKVKRDFNKNHHYQDYFRTIMNISKLKNVKIVTGEEKAFEVISMSSLVVCTPYTSAALISKHLGIKTVFFTSKNQYQLPVKYEGIDVLVGQEKLYEYLKTKLYLGN